MKIEVVATDDRGAKTSALQTYPVIVCRAISSCDEEHSAEDGLWWQDDIVVHWTSPRPGAPLPRGTAIPLEAEVKSTLGQITKVEFLVDDRVLGSVTEPPYRYTRGAEPGRYALTIRAWDSSGVQVTSPVNPLIVE